jgi:site-specific DNA-cytosine methylase
MKVLDLFCGLGGWSKAFADAGHQCTGVDIKNLGYPYRFIKADLMDWKPDQYYDVILASPPCTQFSQVVKNWTGKCNEMKGLDLVYAAFSIILQIKPRYWVIENVKGLASFLPPQNYIIPYGKKSGSKKAYLWSNIKSLKIPEIERTLNRKAFKSSDPKLAEIPLALSQAVLNKVD